MTAVLARTYSPPEVAKRYGAKPSTVLGWIRSGRLEAINLSSGTRPRFRITPEALAIFESARSVRTVPASRKRRKRETGMVEYF